LSASPARTPSCCRCLKKNRFQRAQERSSPNKQERSSPNKQGRSSPKKQTKRVPTSEPGPATCRVDKLFAKDNRHRLPPNDHVERSWVPYRRDPTANATWYHALQHRGHESAQEL
jgi:hypothetical protein